LVKNFKRSRPTDQETGITFYKGGRWGDAGRCNGTPTSAW